MQRYYILLKATGESGLPAWLPYRLTATSAELAVEKGRQKMAFSACKIRRDMLSLKDECVSIGTRCTFLALRNNKKGEFLYYGRKNNYGTAAPKHGGRGDH